MSDAHRLPPSLCPSCGYMADAASSLLGGSEAPVAGDLTLCIGCGAMMQFNAALQIKALSPAEFESIRRADPEQAAMLLKTRRLIRQNRHRFPIPDRGGSA